MPKYHPVNPFDLDVVAEGVNEWKGSLPIGASSKIMNSLRPLDQSNVAAAVDCLDHELDCGRWGRPESIARHFELDAHQSKALDKFHEAAVVDHVCTELQARNRDNDAPPPPLTSRDHVAAAWELHTGE